ncbi:cupin domain-containing protein [Rikenella microfusus]|uniref:Cupin domain n=1 Tax=Rikenella microfusus TaxID=28139 RepID=A0A379MTN5_9BACT|nr:cupin domain-containing protein [Rikenella microfusus]SUE35084.1 Cupin domain [Rikenella microfusus]HJE88453.1 cupin domain-containing protein [Rikenella microfusus]
MENSIFFNPDTAEWLDLGGGLRRMMMGHDDRIMMVKVDFERGAVGATHSHPHSQSSLIERGVFEVTIGGRKKTLRAGDGYFVPSGVEHGAVALEAGTIVDVFAPAREDFL